MHCWATAVCLGPYTKFTSFRRDCNPSHTVYGKHISKDRIAFVNCQKEFELSKVDYLWGKKCNNFLTVKKLTFHEQLKDMFLTFRNCLLI
jgi:hypothetical protein